MDTTGKQVSEWGMAELQCHQLMVMSCTSVTLLKAYAEAETLYAPNI